MTLRLLAILAFLPAGTLLAQSSDLKPAPVDAAGSAFFPENFEGDPLRWLSGLRRFEERSLRTSPSSDFEAYRLLCKPASDHPLLVRIENRGGRARLIGKQLSGKGGFELGALVHATLRDLSPAEWRRFRRQIEEAGFWKKPTRSRHTGLDETHILLEGWRDGRYHALDRWNPWSDPRQEKLARLCDTLLAQVEVVAVAETRSGNLVTDRDGNPIFPGTPEGAPEDDGRPPRQRFLLKGR